MGRAEQDQLLNTASLSAMVKSGNGLACPVSMKVPAVVDKSVNDRAKSFKLGGEKRWNASATSCVPFGMSLNLVPINFRTAIRHRQP